MASASASYRVLISRGFFAFSTSLSTPLASLQPYLPYLWARQFGFQQFIPALPPLPSVQPDFEFVQKLVKEYQTPSCSIGITSLSTTQSFSSWWNIIFDELLSSCSPIAGKRIICYIFIHKFTPCLFDILIFSTGLTSSPNRPTKKLKIDKEKNIASSSQPKKSKLLEHVRNSSNLRRSSRRPVHSFDFSNYVDDLIEVEEMDDPSETSDQGSTFGEEASSEDDSWDISSAPDETETVEDSLDERVTTIREG